MIAPTPSRPRRPAVRTVYRWELRKLVSQKRTYMGFALAALLPVIFIVVQLARGQPPHGGDTIFASEIFQSGLATPVLMLTFLAAFFLPLVAALVAGDIVAAEDDNGTLKTILTRSVDRGQVIAAKTLAAMSYGAAAVFLAAVVGTVGGVAAWGFHGITDLLRHLRVGLGSAAADLRGLRLLPDPTADDRRCRRAALDGHAQQRRGSIVGTLGFMTGAGNRLSDPRPRGHPPVSADDSTSPGRACCGRRPTGRRSCIRWAARPLRRPGDLRRLPGVPAPRRRRRLTERLS